MSIRTVIGMIAAVALIGTYWLEAQWTLDSIPEEYTKGPEARVWLKKNEGESALASNRFGETANALKFVDKLYDAGAVNVIVPEACITADEVEVYADGLLVTLPTEPEKRDRVWQLCREELTREGEDASGDPDEDMVFLWWD